MSTLRRILFLLAFAAVFPGLHAASTEPRSISLQFTVYSRRPIEALGYQPVPGKALAPLTFYSGYRGSISAYKGSPVVEFYDLAATVATSGPADAAPVPVARCAVPEGLKSVLFLFFPKVAPAADGLKYDVFAVDDSREKMAAGSFAIINVSGHDYAAHYPGSTAPITVASGVSPSYAASGSVALQLAVRQGERWRRAGRHDFELNDRSRAWVIIFPPDTPQNIYPVINTFIEVRPPERLPVGASVARYP